MAIWSKRNKPTVNIWTAKSKPYSATGAGGFDVGVFDVSVFDVGSGSDLTWTPKPKPTSNIWTAKSKPT